MVNAATGSAGAVVAMLTAYLFVRRMHRTLALADTLLGATLTLLPVVSAIAAILPALDPRQVARSSSSSPPRAPDSSQRSASSQPRRPRDRTLGTHGGDRQGLRRRAAGRCGRGRRRGAAGRLERHRRRRRTAGGRRARRHPPDRRRRGRRRGCDLLPRRRAQPRPGAPWLAVAAAIVAAAHLTDSLALWSSSDTLRGGNLVHVAGWLALLVGGIRDFEWAHRRDAEDAVLDERRRLARELHDGLAQELAYITTESRRLAGQPGVEHLAEAAERALEESRAAILALTRPADEPLERTIAVAAQSIGVRAGIDVIVAVRPGLEVPGEVRQALLRILREAMGNAARHGRATHGARVARRPRAARHGDRRRRNRLRPGRATPP